MVARPRRRAGAAVLLCLLLPLLAAGQWDSEGRPVVVGLSDLKAMKGLKLLGKDLAALADAQTDAGAPRIGQAWCNATSYGRGRSRVTLCAPLPALLTHAPPSCLRMSGKGRRARLLSYEPLFARKVILRLPGQAYCQWAVAARG